MKQEQWEQLLAVIDGKVFDPLPVGFIIDSPWLPGWAGISIMDYYCSEQLWFEANLKAAQQFDNVIFLPGFWSEFGMCTEPSAFGAKCTWWENEFPFAEKIIKDLQKTYSLPKPNPKTDGLLPFVIHRLKQYQSQIEKQDHIIKFAVSRGPLNILSFLLGSTEFLMAIRTDAEKIQKFLTTVTDFIIDWLEVQIEAIQTIDGIFILDDIVGFLGKDDFKQAALPYLKRIYDTFSVKVKFFHNDAGGVVSAPYLDKIGINLFNFSYQHNMAEMKKLVGDNVALLGNIPTVEVLAQGSAADVQNSVKSLLDSTPDKKHIILSCGGGMPPDVSTENIEAFISAAR